MLNSPNLRTLAAFFKEPSESRHSRSAELGKSKLSQTSTDAPATKLMRMQPPPGKALCSLDAFDQLAATGLSGRSTAGSIAPQRAANLDLHASTVDK